MANDFSVPGQVHILSRVQIRLRYIFLAIVFFFIYKQLHQFVSPNSASQSQFSNDHVSTPIGSARTNHNGAGRVDGGDDRSSIPGINSPVVGVKSVVDQAPASAEYGFETSVDDLPTHLYSRIGKVTSLYYEKSSSSSQAYERALLSHKKHDEHFGYKHFIQRRNAIDRFWSKHAYLIHLLVQELNKPAAERLEWLFWHDADVVLLNSEMPLEMFLPPEGNRWAHINLLVSNDLNGLNDGTFFVRVCEWSVYLFAAGLSFPLYRPKAKLRLDEQSALQMVLQYDKYKNNTLHVPQEWFNAYHNYGHDEGIPPEWLYNFRESVPGDLLVHFPGWSGDTQVDIIDKYLGKVGWTGSEKKKWNIQFSDTKYAKDIPEWWKVNAERETIIQGEFWRRYHIITELGGKMDKKRDLYTQKLKAEMSSNGAAVSDINKAVKRYLTTFNQKRIDALRIEEKMRLNGTHLDNVKAA